MTPRPDTGSKRGVRGQRCTACGHLLKRRPDYYHGFYCPQCDAALYEDIRLSSQTPGQIEMTAESIADAEYWLARGPKRERVPYELPRADCESCGGDKTVKPVWLYWLFMGACTTCGVITKCPEVTRFRNVTDEGETSNGS